MIGLPLCYKTITYFRVPLVILLFCLSACQPSSVRPPAGSTSVSQAVIPTGSSNGASEDRPRSLTSSPTNSWYSVYFTDPSDPASKSYRGGPDQDLAAAIRRARASVDVAVLQLNLWSVRDALINAHRRGVRVRMVTDSDYFDQQEVQALAEAGIPVVGDRREGLMHNKFIVIDQFEVWTGSMNFTVSETYRNNNTLMRIRSTQLAQNYTTEFEEMFLDGQFGPGSPANTPHPNLNIDGSSIQNCFSPDDGCIPLLTSAISASAGSDCIPGILIHLR